MALTEDKIGQFWRQANTRDDSWMPHIHVRFYRAVEAAATAPLLESVSSLTARNTELTAKLAELEAKLAQTQQEVYSLEDQLEWGPHPKDL